MVGIGPGGPLDRTRRAEEAIRDSDLVVAYKPYLKRIGDLLDGKETIGLAMRRERERCEVALTHASEGRKVALVSSGDPGVYGMAGILLEMAHARGDAAPIEIISGVTASSSAAARLGAPLMCDYAVISLSNLLVPWEGIRKRLEAVVAADLVVAIFNPQSHTRRDPLAGALEILRQHRAGDTPVGVARCMGQEEESVTLATLDGLDVEAIDMHTTLIVGNSLSKRIGDWFVTARGYDV